MSLGNPELKREMEEYTNKFTDSDIQFLSKCIDKTVQGVSEVIGDKIPVDSYFLGRIDMLLTQDKVPVLIEVNGSSTRGLGTIIPHFRESYLYGYQEAIDILCPGMKECNILVPIMDADDLGFEVQWAFEILKRRKSNNVFLVKYSEILNNFIIENKKLFLDYGEHQVPIDVIAREGIIRRSEEFTQLIGGDTKIISPAYAITDDKGITYNAIEEFNKEYGTEIMVPVWKRAENENQLYEYVTDLLESGIKHVVTKPFGGSGAAGMGFFNSVEEMETSLPLLIEHFEKKYQSLVPFFPATVSEMIEANTYKGRVHDFGVYLSTKNGKIEPMNVFARTAPRFLNEKDASEREKRVVNLSQEGRVDFSSALSLRPEELKIANITEEQYVNALIEACLAAYAVNEYHQKHSSS